MKLSIFHNGQFFIGLIEYTQNNKTVFAKYTFGTDPDYETIQNFINKQLLELVNKSKVKTKKRKIRKKN